MSIRSLAMTAVSAALFASPASAEPVKLKLAMFSADSEMTWVSTINPWADAVNAAGIGIIEIDKYPNGALGRALPQQAQMVLDGVTDIAFVIPGVSPGRFRDNEVMDLPGLFRDMGEATRVYTRLIQKHALEGFDDYFVIGAMGTPPFEIDARTKVTSLADLKGKKIRVTNSSQTLTLKKLGAIPILLPVPEVPEAIGRGTIDGAAEFPGAMFDFGIDRVTKYDYFANVGVSSLTLLMNRKKFDALPPAAQDILKKYSGEWYGNLFIAEYGKYVEGLMGKMTEDKNRVINYPTVDDVATLEAATQDAIAEWLQKSPRNPALLDAVKAEIAALRGGQ
jgi:TRAP-type C4-dicarboxylate transport system substrate-binding protein